MKKTYTNTIKQDLDEHLDYIQRDWIRISVVILLTPLVLVFSAIMGFFDGIKMAWVEFTLDCIKGNYVSPEQRKKHIKEQCGCVCYCPNCEEPLNDQACEVEEDLATYTCSCGINSTFNFGIAPVPIMV